VAEFIPGPAAPADGHLATVREDIHIHAPYDVVRDRLLAIAKHGEWLGTHFRDYEAAGNTLTFTLALPGRSEVGRLTVDDSDQFGVRYFRNGGGGEIAELSWAIHVETAQDVHLTVEASFDPRRGLFGPILELTLLRPQRTQALRESIWNLKQLIEREHPRQPIV
jgi:hypothetical protein